MEFTKSFLLSALDKEIEQLNTSFGTIVNAIPLVPRKDKEEERLAMEEHSFSELHRNVTLQALQSNVAANNFVMAAKAISDMITDLELTFIINHETANHENYDIVADRIDLVSEEIQEKIALALKR